MDSEERRHYKRCLTRCGVAMQAISELIENDRIEMAPAEWAAILHLMAEGAHRSAETLPKWLLVGDERPPQQPRTDH